jgi:hypothetical protein
MIIQILVLGFAGTIRNQIDGDVSGVAGSPVTMPHQLPGTPELFVR